MNLKLYLKSILLVFLLIFSIQLTHGQTFVHPGILHTEDDFARIRAKIAQNAEPWASAYAIFSTDAASNKNYVLRGPADSVQRDATLGLRNYTIFIRDAAAAYNTAVMWKLTGDSAYAKKSIQIMNAWSYKLKVLYGSDAQLGAGQIGFRWANAAEIIRYSYPGWAAADIAQFQTMLKTVFVPWINMYGDANWGGGCIKGMMSIGIFCNDTTIYKSALNAFNNDPCTSLSKIISPSGQNSESGRDQIHAQVNIGHLAEVAWVAKNQGLDLFSTLNNRILTGFEYTAQYMLGYTVPWDVSVHRCTMGPWSSITGVNRSTAELCPMYEMVYNYYVKHKGLSAPFTTMAVANTRIENKYTLNYDGEHLTGWGTLMFSLDEGTATTAQTINFPAISRKKMGDADFDPGATASSGLPVVYSSADPTVATIVANKVHIVSAGNVVISAYQVGNSTYTMAPKASQTMTLVFDPYQQFEGEGFTAQSGIQVISATDNGAGSAIASQNGTANAVYSGAKLGTKGASLMYARYSSTSDTAVTVNVRLDSPTGPKIGTFKLAPTGGSQVWKTDSCGLNGSTGLRDIYLYFGGKVNINWLKCDSIKTYPTTTAPTPIVKLEAENYSDISSGVTSDATSIGNIKSGNWISIKNVNLGGVYKIEARASSNSTAGSTISKNVEIHLDALTGPIIATIVVPKTGSWTTFTNVSTAVSNLSGVHTLFFKFTATGGSFTSFLFNLDWFQLYYNTQTITFAPLANKTTADADYSPGAVASSGLPISYASSNPGVATISGQNIHIVGSGNTIITASQAGNTVYSFATPVSNTLNVKKTQLITFNPIAAKNLTDTDFDPAATTTSGLKISYKSSDTTIAKIIAQKLHIVGSGSATITASQAGDSTFVAALPVSVTLLVKKPQLISFGKIAAKNLSDPDFDPAAVSNSGLPVSYSSSDTSIATIINQRIHILQSGTTTITATQPGDTAYSAASPVGRTLVIKKAQTINFGTLAVKTTTDTDFYAGATTNSGLPLTYSSSDTTVAVILGSKIHIVAGGITNITALQPADSIYSAAVSVVQPLIVKKTQSIVFSAISVKTLGDADFDPAATASSGLSVSYSSSDTSVASIINNKVHLKNSGKTIITAVQAGDNSYAPAISVSVMLQVKKNQVINFAALAAKMPGDADFTINASATSGLAVSLTSSNTGVVQIIANQAHIISAGTAIITATQPGDSTYNAATNVQQTLTVNPINLTLRYLNNDYNNPSDNNIKAELNLVNNGTVPLNYSEYTIRYWFTPENYSGINTSVDYAQIGSSAVHLNYIPSAFPLNGALGYIQYTFDASAGALQAGAQSGPIRCRFANQDWSNFNETDDYSYLNTSSYTDNTQITVYRNGVLVWGTEPATVPIQTSLSVWSQNMNSGTTTNSISTYLKINNDGNTAINYNDLTMRYWFTADGTPTLNYWVDYAKLGNSNVSGQFTKTVAGLSNTDTYLEVKFSPSTGTLYPLSSTGNIQQRITKSDWSNFSLSNDYSYLPASSFTVNSKITLYYKGQLIFGNEPSPDNFSSMASLVVPGTSTDKPIKTSLDNPASNTIYPNPAVDNTFYIKTTADLANQIVQLSILDLRSGLTVYKKSLPCSDIGVIRVDFNRLTTGIYSVQLNQLPPLKLMVR